MQNTWFKNWFNSPYYHLLYKNRDRAEAAAFIDKLVQYENPAANSLMLDIACGKGRHARQLAAKGFDVTGIDLSVESIEAANQFATDNLHFYRHDMRLLFWINYFDYAFNLFTSFGYFRTQREHDDAMRCMSKALKKNGILIIDYLNMYYAEDRLVAHTEKETEGIHFSVDKWYDDHYFFKKITVTDPSEPGPMEFTEKVAKFSLGDFTEMLSYQGLQIQEVFGNYELGSYDIRKSPRLLIRAKKI